MAAASAFKPSEGRAWSQGGSPTGAQAGLRVRVRSLLPKKKKKERQNCSQLKTIDKRKWLKYGQHKLWFKIKVDSDYRDWDTTIKPGLPLYRFKIVFIVFIVKIFLLEIHKVD